MKLIIDSADTQAIRKLCEYYPIDGVTTNPSILNKAGRQPYEVLKEIRQIIGNKDLHVQVVCTKAEDIIAEAEKIRAELGENTFIKIPVTFEGVKAIKILSQEKVNCTGTAVYTIEQAYMAAHAGAKWIAPYVNRIENIYGDGIQAVRNMQQMLEYNGYDTQIVGASFHRIEQITALMQTGIGAATISAEMLLSLLDNNNVDSAVENFTKDFEKLCGNGKTMLNGTV